MISIVDKGLNGSCVTDNNIEYNVKDIENNLIEEAALELAFEGSRWEDLVRIARRREDPAFLANKIYDKLRAEGNAEAGAVRSKLMNKANWYLPFEWEIKED